MLRLALKMLFGDTGKYLMLVAGLVFATFLMAQQAAVFCGLMSWTTDSSFVMAPRAVRCC